MTLEELLALLPDNTTGAIDAADLRTIVTELYTRDDALQVLADGLDDRVAQLEAEVTTLQSDVDTVEAQVAVNSTRIDELETAGDGYAQVFSYLWVTSAGPGAGKVTANAWSMAATTLQVSETTDDGQSLTFAVMDGASRAEIEVLTSDGKALKANVTGPAVDQGTFRNIPIAPISVVGAAPVLNQKTTVAIIVWP